MRERSGERGQATIVAVLSMLCILSFVGLAVDSGMLFHSRRTLQIAADSAAIAAATEAAYNDMTPYAAASSAAALDGFGGATSGGASNNGNGAQNSANGVTL